MTTQPVTALEGVWQARQDLVLFFSRSKSEGMSLGHRKISCVCEGWGEGEEEQEGGRDRDGGREGLENGRRERPDGQGVGTGVTEEDRGFLEPKPQFGDLDVFMASP